MHKNEFSEKLDGVGPVDNRPSPTSLSTLLKKVYNKCDTRHVTCDTWQLTHYTWHMTYANWHMTCDTWHTTHGVGWTFSLHFSSPSLTVWNWQYIEDIYLLNHDWLNESMKKISDKGDCRTATPGLLKSIWDIACNQGVYLKNKFSN